MELDKYLVGLAIFGFFIAMGLYVINANITEGNIDTSEDNSTSILTTLANITSETYDISESQAKDLTLTSISEDAAEDSLYKKAGSTITRLFDSFKLVRTIAKTIEERLGLPEKLVSTFIYTIAVIFVSSALIFLFFRFQPR